MIINPHDRDEGLQVLKYNKMVDNKTCQFLLSFQPKIKLVLLF